MATIDLSGEVLYPPGPWGLHRPVSGAQLEILDLDLGNGPDSLWTGQADRNGQFHAVSDARWQDQIAVTVPSGFPPRLTTQWIPDLSDVLAVAVKIKADGREATLPVPINHGNIAVPLLVPWAPTILFARVDGNPINDGPGAYAAIQSRVDAGQQEIRIEIYGPDVQIFEPLTRGEAQLVAWLRQRMQVQTLTGGEVAAVLLAIAVIILAVAALTAVVLFGLAVIYAIHKNYEAVDWEITFDPTTGQPTLKTKLRKRA